MASQVIDDSDPSKKSANYIGFYDFLRDLGSAVMAVPGHALESIVSIFIPGSHHIRTTRPHDEDYRPSYREMFPEAKPEPEHYCRYPPS